GVHLGVAGRQPAPAAGAGAHAVERLLGVLAQDQAPAAQLFDVWCRHLLSPEAHVSTSVGFQTSSKLNSLNSLSFCSSASVSGADSASLAASAFTPQCSARFSQICRFWCGANPPNARRKNTM